MPGTTFGRDPKTIAQNIRRVLGDTVDLGRSMNNGDMGLYEGPSQSTYGVPFAIDGTASVVEDKVAIWIAGFKDPIKAIFDTSVHKSQKVIFKRKWVKGGQALVVPERAPARTISVAFDQREERLTRHAIALEQSIYLYQREEDAREDLDMKLEGIRLQLEQVSPPTHEQPALCRKCTGD
jgi:exonuclease VII small subunit